MKAPFPYFGGKARVADLVWERFGNVPNYVEPFFGSGAVLLARPHAPGTETVNDANAFLSNFWRALQADPDAVAHYADWPVNECDLSARHRWLVDQGAAHVAQCKTSPDYYDAKIAGWWVWGACQWIGSGWCDTLSLTASGEPWAQRPQDADAGTGVRRKGLPNKRPNIGHDGYGVHRKSISQQIPHLGDAGTGGMDARACISQKIPSLDPGGRGAERTTSSDKGGLYGYLRALSERLRRVRVCCGDWSRVMGPTPTVKHGLTGVFLDPPYSEAERDAVYSVETPGVAADVLTWCKANGHNPLLRVALCGYSGEHDALEELGWSVVAWKAGGGYGSQGEGRGRENANRERIWFSPSCLTPGLFGALEGLAG